jgi:hypothetical protein
MFEAMLAVFYAAVVIILVWLAKGAMLTPVPLGDGQVMSVVIRAGENAGQTLQGTVEALKWLKSNGTLPIGVIIIRDEGMDKESLGLAKRLAQSESIIELDTEDKWTYPQTALNSQAR